MLEIIYRIYEVADPEAAKHTAESQQEFGLNSVSSQSNNTELLMDCMLTDSRDEFKQVIKSMYGDSIRFRYSSNMKPGDLYCIIIGEHCYNTTRYFNKIHYKCDRCGCDVETYYGRPISFSDYELKTQLYNQTEYANLRFCSNRCKSLKLEELQQVIRSESLDDCDVSDNAFVTRDMFYQEGIEGYIYKITKKSTDEWYIGKTIYAPMFRWAEHMQTARFPISGIQDYKFEVLYIVPTGENILEVEKRFIQTMCKIDPTHCLNIQQTAQIRSEVEGQLSL